MGSVYGIYDLGSNWFAKGVASYGNSKIKNASGRVVGVKGTTLTKANVGSKYDSRTASLEAGFGYNYALGGAVLTPYAGVQYTNSVDGKYTEAGAVLVNTVKKRSYDQFTGVLGLGVSSSFAQGDMLIMPEAHASMSQRLGGKNPNIVSQLSGFNSTVSTKYDPVKTSGAVGGSVTVKSGMTEVGLGGDVNMAKKYTGYQGSLKVRVNF
jgi:outer membrane autotransporter protein